MAANTALASVRTPLAGSPCVPHGVARRPLRAARLVVQASGKPENQRDAPMSRRELTLNSSALFTIGALLDIGGAPRPKTVGVQDVYGSKQLSLCPPNPNCISTAEEANDLSHYVPQWTYNPEEGRGKKNPATQAQAMAELRDVVEKIDADGFTQTIISQTDNYLYAEFKSPTFGFIDDVEFYFPGGQRDLVEYRSASRVGDSDFDINRKRIKAIRLALQKKGWKSIGF